MVRSAAITVSAWGLAVLVSTMPGTAAQHQQQREQRPREDMSTFLPPGSGRDLVAKECSTCHDLKSIVQLRASKEAWEALVLDMVARGAPLMVDEADTISGYLSTVFGPTAPPLVNVNTASREELLKLPGLTPAHADTLIGHRKDKGPLSSRDELKSVLGLDDAAFEKVKWYVRAQGS